MRFKIHSILLAVIATTLPSCSTSSTRMERFYVKIMAAKEKSLNQWQSTLPLDYVGLRTAMILDGAEFLTITNSHVTADGKFLLQYRIDNDQAHTMTFGSAVPIRSDGYFLTARHCVDGSSDQLVTLAADGDSVRMVKSDFRVVWATDKREKADLALIHADVRPFEPFEFADRSRLNKNDVIGTTGWSSMTRGDSNPLSGMAVGHLISQVPLSSDHLNGDWNLIQHTAPLHPGDSGGPIVNEQGQLVGVNGQVWISLSEQLKTLFTNETNSRPAWGYVAIGTFPDLPWLESLIEADRERRRHNQTASDRGKIEFGIPRSE